MDASTFIAYPIFERKHNGLPILCHQDTDIAQTPNPSQKYWTHEAPSHMNQEPWPWNCESPRSLHTTLEGPTEYVNTRWMWNLHGFLHGIQWIMFHGHLEYFHKPPLGGRRKTKPPWDHGSPNSYYHWFILVYHVWGPAWTNIHCNSIRWRARSRMTSHYTRGSVTTPDDLGGVLGRPLDTFFWALTITWLTALRLCVKWPLTVFYKAKHINLGRLQNNLNVGHSILYHHQPLNKVLDRSQSYPRYFVEQSLEPYWNVSCSSTNLSYRAPMLQGEPAVGYKWTGWVWEITG